MTIVFEIVAEAETCFDVRQKYRMILIFFDNFRVNVVIDLKIILTFQTKLFTNDQSNVFNDSNSSHRSYWIFTIDEVHQFMFSFINRWMIFVEVLTFRTCRNIDELTIVSIDEQRVNSFMMNVAMRIMRLLFEKSFIMTSKLWKHHWNFRLSNRRNFERQFIRRKMLRLDYKITYKNFKTMWLFDEHIHWKNHFKFYQIVFARLNLFKNAVQRQLRDDRNVFQIVIRQFRFFEFFRTKCQLFHANFDRFSDFIDVVFQFVIRRYIFRIFDIFQTRVFERTRNQTKKNVIRNALMNRLDDRERFGCAELNVIMIRRFIQAKLVFASTRTARHEDSYFEPFFVWNDRVFQLFQSHDDDQRKSRFWKNENFRIFDRQLRNIIREELGAHHFRRYEQFLRTQNIRHFLIILQFDVNHLSVMRKTVFNHTTVTQEIIRNIISFLKIKWLVTCYNFDDFYYAFQISMRRQYIRIHDRFKIDFRIEQLFILEKKIANNSNLQPRIENSQNIDASRSWLRAAEEFVTKWKNDNDMHKNEKSESKTFADENEKNEKNELNENFVRWNKNDIVETIDDFWNHNRWISQLLSADNNLQNLNDLTHRSIDLLNSWSDASCLKFSNDETVCCLQTTWKLFNEFD